MLSLAWKNIGDNALRSWIVASCAALIACVVIGTTLVIQGSGTSLQKVVDRLGADILVIPRNNRPAVEQALLMGVPVTVWMPRSVVDTVGELPGVATVSPQLFLSTMRGASCCSVSDMFMIAYDPATDFTIHPWLAQELGRDLGLGEAIGGTYVIVPEGRDNILIYGYEIDLVGSLEPTGSGLDQSMFFTYETALEIARFSPMAAERELVIAPESISAALVRVAEGTDPHQVAVKIEAIIPGITAIESGQLFQSQRQRLKGLMNGAAALSFLTWTLCVLLSGLVTSLAIAQRRREIGVLRALGATRGRTVWLLMTEGLVLALAGGLAGVTLATFAIFLFRDLVISQTHIPFLYPSPLRLIFLSTSVLGLSMLSVVLATLFPVLRISLLESGTTLKEMQ